VAELVLTVPASVLAVYAHPDDPDVAAGGTLAAWARAGAVVDVCIAAEGDKGSVNPADDPVALAGLRRREVEAAGTVLGVRGHHWLGYPDGELDDSGGLRRRLVEVIRHVRPQVVVGSDPTAVFFGQHYVNHRDHRLLGWATIDAVAPAAGNPHYFPAAGAAHAVRSLYLSGTLEPDVWVDISDTIDVKAEALACHTSQVGDPGEWLRGVVRQRAEDAGRRAGVRFAEGFRRVQLES
jgi:LmbE family N-acetylglucosaminyl deacetylase